MKPKLNELLVDNYDQQNQAPLPSNFQNQVNEVNINENINQQNVYLPNQYNNAQPFDPLNNNINLVNQNKNFHIYFNPFISLEKQNKLKVKHNYFVNPDSFNIKKFMIIFSIISFIIALILIILFKNLRNKINGIFIIIFLWIILNLIVFCLVRYYVIKKNDKYIYFYYQFKSKNIFIYKIDGIDIQIPLASIINIKIEIDGNITKYILNVEDKPSTLLFKIYTRNQCERVNDENNLNEWINYLKTNYL